MNLHKAPSGSDSSLHTEADVDYVIGEVTRAILHLREINPWSAAVAVGLQAQFVDGSPN